MTCAQIPTSQPKTCNKSQMWATQLTTAAPQSRGQHNSIPGTVLSTGILLGLLGHVRLAVTGRACPLLAPVYVQECWLQSKRWRLRAWASGHEMQNLLGSNRNNDAGQAAGRWLEGRAKMKTTQRQNIDTLDWTIEKVSNYLWRMLTFSTVILKACVKILSVAWIKLLLYHHISRNWLMAHKSKAPLIIFACSLAEIC